MLFGHCFLIWPGKHINLLHRFHFIALQCVSVSSSVQAAVTNYHGLDGLNNEHLFLSRLEGGKSKDQVLADVCGIWQGSVPWLTGGHLAVYIFLLGSTRSRNKPSWLSSYKWTILIMKSVTISLPLYLRPWNCLYLYRKSLMWKFTIPTPLSTICCLCLLKSLDFSFSWNWISQYMFLKCT